MSLYLSWFIAKFIKSWQLGDSNPLFLFSKEQEKGLVSLLPVPVFINSPQISN